jgi:hypothetical protein
MNSGKAADKSDSKSLVKDWWKHLEQDYELLGEIGSGTFGIVVKAVHI